MDHRCLRTTLSLAFGMRSQMNPRRTDGAGPPATWKPGRPSATVSDESAGPARMLWNDSWNQFRRSHRATCAFRAYSRAIAFNPWVLGSSPRRPTHSELSLCNPVRAWRLPGMGRGWPGYGRGLGARTLHRPAAGRGASGLDGSGGPAAGGRPWCAPALRWWRPGDLPGWVCGAEPDWGKGACLPPRRARCGAAVPLGARDHAACRDDERGVSSAARRATSGSTENGAVG